ncbi:PorP/SprF family type IX secretion system membrane protein [Rufibacter roseus]|uniref:Type IX secretion system membrane protein PorP/SprF n=1 Tax=Rufibacter roseus TaxID=1567108 RepID=A0ABW2DGP4_9BACT|nr:type IX secretion system membrane protein PorP/SprF [Rufibacter roseus]
MKKILFPLLFFWAFTATAQQSAYYTQYIFNGLIINPAYAGSKGVLNISGMHRSQWSGLEGAPTTQTIALDGAVLNQRIGLGLQVMNDVLGAQGQKSALASAAVRINVGASARLALGLAGGVSQYYVDGTKLHLLDPEQDQAIPLSKERNFLPDTKAGLFFNTERFFLGLSAFNLISFKNEFTYTPVRHFFLTSGYVFHINEMLKFKPSFLLKEDFKSPTNLDLNAFLLIGDRIWVGGTYRKALRLFNPERYRGQGLDTNNAWALMTELYLTPKIKIGYAHDMTLNSLQGYASHELSVGFYFFKKEATPSLTIRHF